MVDTTPKLGDICRRSVCGAVDVRRRREIARYSGIYPGDSILLGEGSRKTVSLG